MASQAERDDALYNLRLSIQNGTTPILTTTKNPSSAADTVQSLAQATYLSFNVDSHHAVFDLRESTRFSQNGKPVDLRSVYFAWQNKDENIANYFTALQSLNEELPSGVGGSVESLGFNQRLELFAYLNGESETGPNIAPLAGAEASSAAKDSAAIAGGQGVPVQKHAEGGGSDDRTQQIYEGERMMGDHNTILWGNKPTDFSQFRKTAAQFLRSRPTPAPAAPIAQPLVSGLKKPSRKHEQPIILLSPSASSLLRMSNIKSFLDEGIFVPPNEATNTSANLLQLTRVLPSISTGPFRFIIVDSTSQFKPSYWPRVVAIFTTGQTWQFKSYKYPNPAELFAHYPGVYVGWQNEQTPENVLNWGRGVLNVQVDKWTGSERGRWRDREVVEKIWGRIEEGMRKGGWTREGPGMAGSGTVGR